MRKVFGPPKGGWPTDVIVPFERAKLVAAALKGKPPETFTCILKWKEIVNWSDYAEFDYIIPLARNSVEGSK